MLGFLFWFIIVIAVIAVVIIGVKWLFSLTGITIPQPLLVMFGIVCFIVLMVALWHFVGSVTFNTPSPLHFRN